MRIYIPARIGDLAEPSVSPRVVHAVTHGLIQAIDVDEPEVLEAVAMNAAADDSLRLLEEDVRAAKSAIYRRCVIVAEVADTLVAEAAGDVLPTALIVLHAVPWDRVESIHVDDRDAEQDVAEAAHGDEAAFERAADGELMWYDVLERNDLYTALAR